MLGWAEMSETENPCQSRFMSCNPRQFFVEKLQFSILTFFLNKGYNML